MVKWLFIIGVFNLLKKEIDIVTTFITIITTILPYILIIPFILLIWWLVSLMLNLKSSSKKQVEQNSEIIELLKRLNNNKDNILS
jgi:hypothetical protein